MSAAAAGGVKRECTGDAALLSCAAQEHVHAEREEQHRDDAAKGPLAEPAQERCPERRADDHTGRAGENERSRAGDAAPLRGEIDRQTRRVHA